jgi:aminoacrylate hydrolase
MVIGAQDDQITPPGFSEELARRIPKSQFVMLPRGGHICPMTMADVYNIHMLAFLKSKTPARSRKK